MKWVGILYINDNFLLNGRLYAKSWSQLINKFFVYQNRLPRWIIILNTKPSICKEEISDFQEQLSKYCYFTQYNRKFPFIYFFKNKKNYAVSIMVGLIISLINIAYYWKKTDQIVSEIIQPKFIGNDYQISMKKLAKACDNKQCLNELAIFPAEIIVKLKNYNFETNLIQLGCKKMYENRTIFKCINY